MSDSEFIDLAVPIPVFPLPNCVLFPQVALRLHVFEPRYRALTKDALAGQGAMAIALLREGWEGQYEGTPPIHSMVCVGRILASKALDDGRYDLLLVGICRAKVVDEDRTGPYRKARLRLVSPREDVESAAQARMKLEIGEVISNTAFDDVEEISALRSLLTSELAVGGIADVLAHRLLRDVAVKQQLLEEVDVEARVERLIDELHTLSRIIDVGRPAIGRGPIGGPQLN